MAAVAKKAKIIDQYNVSLFCEDCGTQMESAGYKVDESIVDVLGLNGAQPARVTGHYLYVCPRCGATHKSQQVYPYQIVEFDLSNMEEMPDEYASN